MCIVGHYSGSQHECSTTDSKGEAKLENPHGSLRVCVFGHRRLCRRSLRLYGARDTKGERCFDHQLGSTGGNLWTGRAPARYLSRTRAAMTSLSNPAASVDAPTRVCLRCLRLGRRTTEQRCCPTKFFHILIVNPPPPAPLRQSASISVD